MRSLSVTNHQSPCGTDVYTFLSGSCFIFGEENFVKVEYGNSPQWEKHLLSETSFAFCKGLVQIGKLLFFLGSDRDYFMPSEIFSLWVKQCEENV